MILSLFCIAFASESRAAGAHVIIYHTMIS